MTLFFFCVLLALPFCLPYLGMVVVESFTCLFFLLFFSGHELNFFFPLFFFLVCSTQKNSLAFFLLLIVTWLTFDFIMTVIGKIYGYDQHPRVNRVSSFPSLRVLKIRKLICVRVSESGCGKDQRRRARSRRSSAS